MCTSREGHEQIVRLLLEKGAHVNDAAKFNDTALVWASRNGHEWIVPLLLEKGAHINAAAEFGDNGKSIGADCLLLEKGADVNDMITLHLTSITYIPSSPYSKSFFM